MTFWSEDSGISIWKWVWLEKWGVPFTPAGFFERVFSTAPSGPLEKAAFSSACFQMCLILRSVTNIELFL